MTFDELKSLKKADCIPILKDWAIQALDKLLAQDGVLFAVGAHEQCLCHRLAIHLASVMPVGTDIDCEYNRWVQKLKELDYQVAGVKKLFRPDIVAHQRLSAYSDNFIAIEAKPSRASRQQITTDRQKIDAIVTKPEYNYELGVSVRFMTAWRYVVRHRQARVQYEFFTAVDGWTAPLLRRCPITNELVAVAEGRDRHRPQS